MSAKTRKVADRIISGYITVKVPVGYAVVKKIKGLVESSGKGTPSDEELEEIASRFLDLALYSVTQEQRTEDPSDETHRVTLHDLLQVADEVMHSDEDELDFDDEDEDEDMEGDEGSEPEGRF